MKKNFLILCAVLGLSVLASSCEDKRHEKERKPEKKHSDASRANPEAFIQKMSKNHLQVVQTFSGPGNLQGVVVQPQEGGRQMIMYVNTKDQYAIYGTLLNESGQNLTEEDKAKYITPLLAKKIAENLPMATSFTQGSDTASYKIIALADPNCSACHAFYEVVKPAIDSGQLQVSWILVYFVQQDSEGKAAAILGAANPAEAMAENEEKFDSSTEEGGVQALTDIPAELQKKLAANMKFMNSAGISSTPTLVFYNKRGELTYTSGAPQNIDAFLKENAPQITSPTA